MSNAAAVRSVPPSSVKDALSSLPRPAASAKLCGSPLSGSVADSVPTAVPAGWFSATVSLERPMPVGARLAAGAAGGGGGVTGEMTFSAMISRARTPPMRAVTRRLSVVAARGVRLSLRSIVRDPRLIVVASQACRLRSRSRMTAKRISTRRELRTFTRTRRPLRVAALARTPSALSLR